MAGSTERNWLHTDNGFPDALSMEIAHAPILDLAHRTLARHATAAPAVIDLGCGNGLLLGKLARRVPGLVPYGIDRDPDRIGRARDLSPDHAGNFQAGDLFDAPRLWPATQRFALAILMLGRLHGADAEASRALRHFLSRQCQAVLVYFYADWAARHGSLAALAARLDVRLSDHLAERHVALATFEAAPASPS